jgi:peroxiredoxin
MTDHKTGTREEWLAARLELLEAEKALTRRSDELARQRQELPWVRIEKEYRFETDEGTASLADLFKGRSQLLIYHFMLGPEYTAGCPACSAIADGFDGSVVHLANHDVTLCAVSRAPLAKLQAYKRRMGWSFPWASSFGSDFMVAGLYQFAPLKRVCLAKCCTPLEFIRGSWRDGYTGAFRLGLEHGIYCLGSNWLLFVLLFPLGIMNIAAMAVLTVLIFAEKMFPRGERIAQGVGLALIL